MVKGQGKEEGGPPYFFYQRALHWGKDAWAILIKRYLLCIVSLELWVEWQERQGLDISGSLPVKPQYQNITLRTKCVENEKE